jgi:ABC-type arginine transport system permease subunit
VARWGEGGEGRGFPAEERVGDSVAHGGLADLVGLARDVGQSTREPFLFFIAVLGFYLFVTWISTTIFGWAERRYAVVGHAR